MDAVTFDTHHFISTLRNAGFEEKQATALSTAHKDAVEQMGLATKGDIDLVRTEMRMMKYQLMAWFGGVQVLSVIAIAALIKI
uniref:DUF1640 domain-containing protein n=1 Tax=Candidatus Kentrum sp. LPFa TaxID=2126335 RepID=A0A450XFR9_9GAMM|nr:MAG: hypothetical protein BECKLPF1236A_GA0070988_100658 [Candidatus Kentron sp. LPFa]VFK12513.1 MAG: hypothetical protein BECKLPF1236B_GA0070989_10374 [Candidatus Kentron sp. LPFa]VFK28143.1 MAG: hypothetical protein BECKLPF1236C_GA0070990_100598 [Candidatus Kentron sp. LPFa]